MNKSYEKPHVSHCLIIVIVSIINWMYQHDVNMTSVVGNLSSPYRVHTALHSLIEEFDSVCIWFVAAVKC